MHRILGASVDRSIFTTGGDRRTGPMVGFARVPRFLHARRAVRKKLIVVSFLVLAGFPADLFVTLVGITFLFAIAERNGAIDWMVHALARLTGERAVMMPWVAPMT